MPILQQKNNDELKHPGDDPNVTDPQENEKDGNVFGKVFDAVFGNYKGEESISADEPDEHPDGKTNVAADDVRLPDETERDIIEDEEDGGSI